MTVPSGPMPSASACQPLSPCETDMSGEVRHEPVSCPRHPLLSPRQGDCRIGSCRSCKHPVRQTGQQNAEEWKREEAHDVAVPFSVLDACSATDRNRLRCDRSELDAIALGNERCGAGTGDGLRPRLVEIGQLGRFGGTYPSKAPSPGTGSASSPASSKGRRGSPRNHAEAGMAGSCHAKPTGCARP